MRNHNYVVGYMGENQCVYGKERKGFHRFDWVDLLTLKQAQKLAKKIICEDGEKINKSVVYKLVEIKSEK